MTQIGLQSIKKPKNTVKSSKNLNQIGFLMSYEGYYLIVFKLFGLKKDVPKLHGFVKTLYHLANFSRYFKTHKKTTVARAATISTSERKFGMLGRSSPSTGT